MSLAPPPPSAVPRGGFDQNATPRHPNTSRLVPLGTRVWAVFERMYDDPRTDGSVLVVLPSEKWAPGHVWNLTFRPLLVAVTRLATSFSTPARTRWSEGHQGAPVLDWAEADWDATHVDLAGWVESFSPGELGAAAQQAGGTLPEFLLFQQAFPAFRDAARHFGFLL